MSFKRHISACNSHNPADYLPFILDGIRYGSVRRDIASGLRRYDDLLSVTGDHVSLAEAFRAFASRSEAFDQLVDRLVAAGEIREKQGELYPVALGFHASPACALDRKLVPMFGIRAYGVHMNGFVRTSNGLELWVGKRSADKAVAPGKLDNLVAGGQPLGLSAADNLVKECAEEADIPEALARRAVPVSAINYKMAYEHGLRDDVLFVYDLELDEAFTPRNTDGELETFFRWPIERVAATVRETNNFKFNVNLVIIDFLIRHGLIGPDHPDYLDLAQGLRVRS